MLAASGTDGHVAGLGAPGAFPIQHLAETRRVDQMPVCGIELSQDLLLGNLQRQVLLDQLISLLEVGILLGAAADTSFWSASSSFFNGLWTPVIALLKSLI